MYIVCFEVLYISFFFFSHPLIPPRQISTVTPHSVMHSSMASSPSSYPRTSSNSFLSTTSSTVDEESISRIVALTNLHEQPVDSFTAPYYRVAIDSIDGGGALQEEVGGARVEDKIGVTEFEEASTEVSNASSSREDLTSTSEVEITTNKREDVVIGHNKEDTDSKHTPTTKELIYTEGNSLLSPVTYSTSHFNALSGLESIDSPDHTQ